jgi:hypothetical protein
VLALAATVLALTSCAVAVPVPSGSMPAFVQVGAREVPFAGLQAWTVVSAESRGSTRLVVFATGSEDGGTVCGPPVLRLHAEESATRVRISVAAYQAKAGANTACPAIGYVPSAQRLVLRKPLGDRTVVDASSGERSTLLVGTDYPALPTPAGLTASPLEQWGEPPAVTRRWSDGRNAMLSLATGAPADVRADGPYGRVLRRFDIGGTPAALYGSGSGQQEVQWTPNRRQTITLRLDDGRDRRWTADQAVALARSVTGYTTESTGRLPQPTTPGTVAAAYSSADGPVRHAPNLLKSSGVFVGVSCQGKGTVTVALRGTAHPFACAETLGQHVVRSVGKPNDTFFLDVTATSGVRWTVTLARASLDGS